ncbi:hypothetical protein KM043_004942 [Ampulex compressa]|nr:hypothetical protein KM043_004942 [Ampulex compressa]
MAQSGIGAPNWPGVRSEFPPSAASFNLLTPPEPVPLAPNLAPFLRDDFARNRRTESVNVRYGNAGLYPFFIDAQLVFDREYDARVSPDLRTAGIISVSISAILAGTFDEGILFCEPLASSVELTVSQYGRDGRASPRSKTVSRYGENGRQDRRDKAAEGEDSAPAGTLCLAMEIGKGGRGGSPLPSGPHHPTSSSLVLRANSLYSRRQEGGNAFSSTGLRRKGARRSAQGVNRVARGGERWWEQGGSTWGLPHSESRDGKEEEAEEKDSNAGKRKGGETTQSDEACVEDQRSRKVKAYRANFEESAWRKNGEVGRLLEAIKKSGPHNRPQKFVDDLPTFGARSRYSCVADAGPRSIPELDRVVLGTGVTLPYGVPPLGSRYEG